MKKFFLTVLLLIVVLLVGAVLARDFLIKTTVIAAAKKLMGVKVEIAEFASSISKQSVDIKGFKIYNPEGFPQEVLLDMPRIAVECDVQALLKKNLHLRKVIVDLKLLNVVKNKDGKMNVDALNVAPKEEKKQETAGKEKKPAESIPMQIDVLELKVDKLVFKDFTKGEKPEVKEIVVGMNKTYTNIASAQDLMVLIMSEPMKQAAIGGAKLYGATAVLGAAFLPAGVAVALTGKDFAKIEIKADYKKTFDVAVAYMTKQGKITGKYEDEGKIDGLVSGARVNIKIVKKEGSVEITVSARKTMLPKPEIANMVLNEIARELQ